MRMTMISGRLAALACAVLAFAVPAQAATYSFDMTIQDVAVSGFVKVNGASPNYVGGGTTTLADLLDYALTLSSGGYSFTASPANMKFIQTWDLTYAADLGSVTQWSLSSSFNAAGGSISIGGNNIYDGGVASIHDMSDVPRFNAFQQPPGSLTARLTAKAAPVAPVPLPAALPLAAMALAALAAAIRRPGRRRPA